MSLGLSDSPGTAGSQAACASSGAVLSSGVPGRGEHPGLRPAGDTSIISGCEMGRPLPPHPLCRQRLTGDDEAPGTCPKGKWLQGQRGHSVTHHFCLHDVPGEKLLGVNLPVSQDGGMAEQIHDGPGLCALGFPAVSSRLSLLRQFFFFPFPGAKARAVAAVTHHCVMRCPVPAPDLEASQNAQVR